MRFKSLLDLLVPDSSARFIEDGGVADGIADIPAADAFGGVKASEGRSCGSLDDRPVDAPEPKHEGGPPALCLSHLGFVSPKSVGALG